jgi:hypothetical protein
MPAQRKDRTMDNQTVGVDLDKLPRAHGVSRDAESPGGKGVLIFFERPLSDDELRTLQDVLARRAESSVAAWDERALPMYVDAIGKAGEQYHAEFNHAHPLPATWRWSELWNRMARATLASPAVSQMDGAAEQPSHETIVREGSNLVCTSCGTTAATTASAGTLDQQINAVMSVPDDQLDEHLRSIGLDPDDCEAAGRKAVAGALNTIGAQAPSRDIDVLREVAQHWLDRALKAEEALAQQVASHAANAGEADEKLLADSLNMMMWLYRRLPVAYGKPTFVDAAIMKLGERLGLDDVPIAIRERAAIASSAAQEGK